MIVITFVKVVKIKWIITLDTVLLNVKWDGGVIKLVEMTYKLYIDDIRNPEDKDFVIARTVQEAKEKVFELGMPSYISFDHDLGEESEGDAIDFVKWLIECDMDNHIIPEGFTFYVHSANPIGSENIECLLNNYLNFLKNNV